MNVKNARNSFEQLNLLKLSLENMRNLECTLSLEVVNKTIKLLPWWKIIHLQVKVFFKLALVISNCLTKHGRNKRWNQLLYLSELSLWHSVPVEDDPGRLVAGRLVELDQELSHHRGQVLDDLLSGPLDPHCSTVPAGMGVHAAHNLHRYSISQRGQQL